MNEPTETSLFLKTRLQLLRDEAEQESTHCLNIGDRDSADAWERIGLRLDEAMLTSKADFHVIAERRWRE